ncbi:MAG: glycosyltransferase family 2 protein [Deltaproteobacteria bacterium]|nr:glycosyltransferase family 2 protein [Deltaproteobacteria bacterium]
MKSGCGGKRIGLMIPCYNVEPFIGDVLRGIPDNVYDRLETLLVIDNHSEDKTREIVVKMRGEMSRDRIRLLCNRRNQNLGGSYKIGFDYFIGNGFDYLIAVHGRGQGQAGEDAKNFLKIIDSGASVDFIGCSRFLKGSELSNYPALRKIGNYLVIALQRMATGKKMSDPGTGHFCVNLKTVMTIPYRNLTSKRSFNNELQMSLALKGAEMREVPHVWRAFSYEKAKFNIWTLGLDIAGSLAKLYLTKKGFASFREFSTKHNLQQDKYVDYDLL